MRVWFGLFLIAHGIITTAISSGSFKGGAGIANPAWLGWWPSALGQSWLLARLGVENSVASTAGGVLWLLGGLALVAAGLSVLGVVVPVEWWRGLAVGGAVISLLALLLYLHPFYVLGIALNVAILMAILWAHWPAAAVAGA